MAIITLTGPTCAGKSTVEAALQKIGFGRAVSHTTRLPRAGEYNGGSYHFVSDEEFATLNAQGAFVETVAFGSNKYAMSAAALRAAQDESGNVAIVVEPHGASQIHAFCLLNGIKSQSVWIDCSVKDQAQRWLTRLAGDMLIGKDFIGPYADRLQLMLSDEAEWREHAYSVHGIHYDMMFNSSENSPEQIAEKIAKFVNS